MKLNRLFALTLLSGAVLAGCAQDFADEGDTEDMDSPQSTGSRVGSGVTSCSGPEAQAALQDMLVMQ